MAKKDYLGALKGLRDKLQSTADERVLEELDEIISGLEAKPAAKRSSKKARREALEQYGTLLLKLAPEIASLIIKLIDRLNK